MNKANLDWSPKPFLMLSTVGHVIAYLCKNRLWQSVSHEISVPFSLPDDFFGINIATQQTPDCDAYVVNKLNALGIKNVRLNLSYTDLNQAPQRLLDKVLDDGFSVLLSLVPPPDQAKIISESVEAQDKWRAFVSHLITHYHSKSVVFEIGNTPNRKKWSGWTFKSFLKAWSIAFQIAEQYKTSLTGANVSDFEPLFSLAFFSGVSEQDSLPSIHSDNLFVERVIEPEAYDHRILGRWLTNVIKFNLIKKARTLASIGKDYGVERTVVSYTTWTLERLVRWSDDPEQKQADYLCRYLVLAAGSGVLEKIYWGPLIDHRDGVIDDRNVDATAYNHSEHWAEHAKIYPLIDNVSHYPEIKGELEYFRARPAFFAFQFLTQTISGAQCVQAQSSVDGIQHFVFRRDQQEIHICWCRDSVAIPVKEVYSALPDKVRWHDVRGNKLNKSPSSFIEQPTYLIFNDVSAKYRPSKGVLSRLPNINQRKTKVNFKNGWQHVPFENNDWRGAVSFEDRVDLEAAVDAMLPESLLESEVGSVLRDTRNKIWTTETASHGTIAIKLNRINRRKRVGYIFRDSKGRRHWNNASVMLRMGVKTPQPLAFFERHTASGTSESYYVCAYLDDPFSARDVFTSMKNGEAGFRGLAHDALLKTIAEFICHMHNRGVLHRDLSPGNILLIKQGDQVQPHAIDIGRARTGITLSTRQRMIDVMRICFILSWTNREKLIKFYNQRLGREVAWWWKGAVRYYIFKIESKRLLRKFFKKKTH